MKSINPNQFESKFESMLVNPKQDLINETLMNYELITKMNELRKIMRVYKTKNIDVYKRVQREYLALIR